jgi:hypothetical protein
MQEITQRLKRLEAENQDLRAQLKYEGRIRRNDAAASKREVRQLQRALERRAQETRLKEVELTARWKQLRETAAALGLDIYGQQLAFLPDSTVPHVAAPPVLNGATPGDLNDRLAAFKHAKDAPGEF